MTLILKTQKPKKMFDFLKSSIDPRILISRAGDEATRVNSSGQIERALANTARLDFDPVMLNPAGLLVEEQKTNLLPRSIPDAPVPTGWQVIVSSGTFSHSLVPGCGRLAGFQQAIKHVQTISGRSPMRYLLTLSQNTKYTFSFFVDVNNSQITSGDNAICRALGFTDATGETNLTLDKVNASGRGSITFTTASDNSGEIRLGIGCNNVATGTFVFSGWQLEEGDGTSYIPTEATTVTRNADVVTITGTDFSDWWQAGKGSALVRARPSTVTGIRPALQFDDATADNIIALRGNAANPELYVRTNGVDQAQIDAGTIAANTSYRLAGAWAENSCAASFNSGSPVLDGVATIPTVTQARLGSDGTNYLNGHIEAIEYYDERIPNSALQVISSTAGYQSIIGSVFRDAIIS